jgi:SAM-dependent methyltransferase
MWVAWGELTRSLRGGASAFAYAHGQPLFDYLGGEPGLAAVFHATMRDQAEVFAAAAVKAYDFGSARIVVDVGGGYGQLLATVLQAAPAARGILLDTAAGVAQARRTLDAAGLSGRCSVQAGDFFQSVPEGDVLLLNGILHDWDDQRGAALLRRCRDAVAADGHLLILEQVRPDQLSGTEAATVVLSDLAMLVYTGGRERSAAEFRQVLADGGFTLTGITPPLEPSLTRMLIAEPS